MMTLMIRLVCFLMEDLIAATHIAGVMIIIIQNCVRMVSIVLEVFMHKIN